MKERYDPWSFEFDMKAHEERAAKQAIEQERRSWLPILEAIAADIDAHYEFDSPRQRETFAARLGKEIDHLRRCLGYSMARQRGPLTPEEIDRRRERTRERVRLFRARRAAKGDP